MLEFIIVFGFGWIIGYFCRVIHETIERIETEWQTRQCQQRMRRFTVQMENATTEEERKIILERQTKSIAKIYGIKEPPNA